MKQLLLLCMTLALCDISLKNRDDDYLSQEQQKALRIIKPRKER